MNQQTQAILTLSETLTSSEVRELVDTLAQRHSLEDVNLPKKSRMDKVLQAAEIINETTPDNGKAGPSHPLLQIKKAPVRGQGLEINNNR